MSEGEQLQIQPPPLSAPEYKFVDSYCQCRDAAKAAVEAGFQARQGNALYRRPAVQAEITARMKNIDGQTDLLLAKKRIVNVEALDKALMAVVTIPRKQFYDTPSLATPKVNAIELGYRRVGLLMDDNFVPDAGGAIPEDGAPRIFRPGGQMIITHRITETKEVMTTQSVTRAEAKPQPPTIEDDDSWKDF